MNKVSFVFIVLVVLLGSAFQLDAAEIVPITVDASKFSNWKRLEFYDGATKLGTDTAGPTQFTVKNLTPGYHVFSVLATDGQETVRTADPKMVVVCRPPADAPASQQ